MRAGVPSRSAYACPRARLCECAERWCALEATHYARFFEFPAFGRWVHGDVCIHGEFWIISGLSANLLAGKGEPRIRGRPAVQSSRSELLAGQLSADYAA